MDNASDGQIEALWNTDIFQEIRPEIVYTYLHGDNHRPLLLSSLLGEAILWNNDLTNNDKHWEILNYLLFWRVMPGYHNYLLFWWVMPGCRYIINTYFREIPIQQNLSDCQMDYEQCILINISLFPLLC